MDAGMVRLPPMSIESEQGLIGAAMQSPGLFDRVADILKAEHFYREEHRVIWTHIAKLTTAGREVDVLTLNESLVHAGDAQRVGGLAYLGEMASNSPGGAGARRWAEIVRDKALLRGLMSAGSQIMDLALETNGAAVAEKVAQADALVAALSESAVDAGPVSLHAVLIESLDHIQRTYDGEVRRMTTGLTELDEKVFDLQAGSLVVIAGRPGMGKTSLALQLGMHIAQHYGAVHVASMEMPRRQIGDRMICLSAGVSLTSLSTGKLTDDDWTAVSAATGRLHELPLHIDDKGGQTVAEIRAKAQQLKRKSGGKLGAVVIDYLQLMQSEGDNQNERISNITRSLKAMAKMLECPVILLSQLNRKVEERPNKRPFMSDLRDSGAIEQDADLILFPYRDEYYTPDSPDRGTAEVEIAKQRNGPTGTARVAWVGERAMFADLDVQEWMSRREREMPMQRPTKQRGFK